VLGSASACVVHSEAIGLPSAAVPYPAMPQSCSARLAEGRSNAHDELNSDDIRLVNWNIQKAKDPDWSADLAMQVSNPDLLILQEVPLNMDVWKTVAADHYRSFAPGHRSWRAMTGVMTLSRAEPLVQCNLSSTEPWLRSPKATVITTYGLTGTHESLLVINMHGLNFTFGTSDFEEQVGQALAQARAHTGPMLLSGDFNTWHPGQSDLLHTMAAELGLDALRYDEDHRKRAFGQPLDHIYARGLDVVSATSSPVTSSDHNPIAVHLKLNKSPRLQVADMAAGS
jgi:endonuclease/exonuclease/phosphatase (EEP) superfamily protein YafD